MYCWCCRRDKKGRLKGRLQPELATLRLSGLVASQVLDVAVVFLAVVFEEVGKAGGGFEGRERARVGPWFGVHLRIVDGEFVIDFGAAGDAAEALDYVERVAVLMAGGVEPGP